MEPDSKCKYTQVTGNVINSLGVTVPAQSFFLYFVGQPLCAEPLPYLFTSYLVHFGYCSNGSG